MSGRHRRCGTTGQWRRHLAVAGLAAWCAAFVGMASAQAQSASQLMEQGQWAEAKQEAMLRDDAASLQVRSRLALWAGDDEQAWRYAQAAVDVGASAAEQRRARAQAARLDWFFGRRDEAIATFRDLVQEAPEEIEFRYALGWRLIDDGAESEGRAILEGLAQRFNDGLITAVDDLVWLGRAMKAAGHYRDANRALSRALDADEDHLEANLRLGQLMWSRFNTAEAEEAFETVLDIQADHPEAQAGLAQIEFYRSGRFAESMALIESAHQAYPGHPQVQRGRAELLIAQGRWEEGQAQAEALLERSPDDGRALAMAASAAFLMGQKERFEEHQIRFDERRPQRPDLLTQVGEFASLNNRHHRAVALYEEALARDEDHAPALRGLGMSLTRIGEEARGIEVLRRAFDADRFQVPVYNTLELYDRGLRDYLTDDVDGFRLRAHLSQFSLIRDLLEPLVGQARQAMAARYGKTLPSLTLEVFSDPQSFSVRTVGLPHIDPHGICFGPVVLTRSPGEGNFNWPMVTWHEVAHSYHLALSKERVPRWFTEGLAEYETRRRDPSWTRFHDVDLARRLVHGSLWSIEEMDEAFMTGRGLAISQAYQSAMLIMAYLDDIYGFETIVALLEAFAEEPREALVFEAVLDKSVAAIDDEFEDWLRDHYRQLMGQELVDFGRISAMMADEDVAHGSRGEAAAYRALVAAAAGDEERAQIQLASAERHGGDEPAVAVVVPLVYQALDDLDAAMDAGQQALDLGVDSIDLRRAMSEMARQLERHDEAYIHAVAAVGLAPMDPQAWQLLMLSGRRADEPWAVIRGRQEYFARAPHDARVARQITGFLEDKGAYDEALQGARRWTEISALDARAHQARGRLAAHAGHLEEAIAAWRRAVLASPARREAIAAEAVEQLEALGHDEAAATLGESLPRPD